MPAVPLFWSCQLLWSPRSPAGDRSGSRPLSTPLESSLPSGQPKEVEAVLIVPLVSGGSCRDPQAVVDVRYKEMDFEEYLNFQTCISFFRRLANLLHSPIACLCLWTSFTELELYLPLFLALQNGL